MLTGGHCIPTCYALWMVLYEGNEFMADKPIYKNIIDNCYLVFIIIL